MSIQDTDVINVTIDRSRHTVLVVDDNDATRYSTARTLRAAGFETAEAGSGGIAIERSAQGVSAVVLDVHLPDIDGFNVCRAIRARPSTEHLPIVHLSATHVASEDRVTGLNAGADAYLVHPAEPAVLIATVQALIRARTAEDELRRSEQRLRAIYDHAQGGIVLIDANGAISDANPAMRKLLGLPPEALIGKLLADLAPADFRESVDSFLGAAGSAWHGEFPLLHADGHPVFFDWNVSLPVPGDMRIAVAMDVSLRHELEQRRLELLEREQAARASAEHSSRTKDDFIAVLSHELRTPLNAIAGWVAILTRRSPTPEAMKGLEAIDRNVKAQARIISDILDVSRINSGKLQLEMEQADPADVIRNALMSMQGSIADKKIRLVTNLQESNRKAWMDSQRFEQVVWNLMTNAIKFSQPEGTITVSLSREHSQATLVVKDEGQGISPEFLPRLFDRFAQSDAPGNRFHGGLGLGLAIVKHIVELHGGEVFAQSEGPGKGATMTVVLPGTKRALAPSAAPSPAEGDPLPEPGQEVVDRPLEGMDILVVEDDPGAAEMLSVVLTDRGATVRAAGSYDSAIVAIFEAWPDAIVSDIGLPGKDGHDLIRAIRKIPSGQRIPSIALTAFSREQDRVKALEAGFDTHLAKPLQPLELVSTLLALKRGAAIPKT